MIRKVPLAHYIDLNIAKQTFTKDMAVSLGNQDYQYVVSV